MFSSAAVGLAIALSLTSAAQQLGDSLELSIDDCVDADRQEVVRLLQIELGDNADQATAGRARRIAITCTAEPDVVRVADPASPASSARLVDLRALGSAERKARARELSLVIRELLDAPRESLPPASSPPPQQAPQRQTAPRPSRALFELSLLASAEKYAGGYAQVGGGIGLRLMPLHWLVLEARLGARLAPTLRAPTGEVSAHGFVGSLGLGIDIFSRESSAGLVVLGRLGPDWIFIEGTSDTANSEGRSVDGVALIGSLASSAWLALGPRLRVTLEPALLVPIKGLTILDRGRTVSSISGIGAAASLGLSLKL